METKQLMQAKKYFEKAKGKRIGTWMSELRRQFVIRMNAEGAESKHIKAVTFLRHDQTWHYLNRYKSNPEVEKIVVEHMDEWIEKGLYPMSRKKYESVNHHKTEYVLQTNPNEKVRAERNKWDNIIESI